MIKVKRVLHFGVLHLQKGPPLFCLGGIKYTIRLMNEKSMSVPRVWRRPNAWYADGGYNPLSLHLTCGNRKIHPWALSGLLYVNIRGSGLGLWCLTPRSTIFQLYRGDVNISEILSVNISCNMNAFLFFDLFMGYIPECKQQLRIMKYIHKNRRYCTL